VTGVSPSSSRLGPSSKTKSSTGAPAGRSRRSDATCSRWRMSSISSQSKRLAPTGVLAGFVEPGLIHDVSFARPVGRRLAVNGVLGGWSVTGDAVRYAGDQEYDSGDSLSRKAFEVSSTRLRRSSQPGHWPVWRLDRALPHPVHRPRGAIRASIWIRPALAENPTIGGPGDRTSSGWPEFRLGRFPPHRGKRCSAQRQYSSDRSL